MTATTRATRERDKPIRITRGSGNVFADLGVPEAERMLVKSSLAISLQRTIEQRALTQLAAAALIGIPQPKLSGILRGDFRGVSEAKLLTCLNRLGHDIEIVVRPRRPRGTPGRTRVIGR